MSKGLLRRGGEWRGDEWRVGQVETSSGVFAMTVTTAGDKWMTNQNHSVFTSAQCTPTAVLSTRGPRHTVLLTYYYVTQEPSHSLSPSCPTRLPFALSALALLSALLCSRPLLPLHIHSICHLCSRLPLRPLLLASALPLSTSSPLTRLSHCPSQSRQATDEVE